MVSLIAFTDKYQGHVRTFYTKWLFITFHLLVSTILKVMTQLQMLHSESFDPRQIKYHSLGCRMFVKLVH